MDEPLIVNQETDQLKLNKRRTYYQSISSEADTSDNIQLIKKQGSFTLYLLFCLLVAVFGSSFQFGWNLGVFNTPYEAIKDFFEDVYSKRHNATMSNSTFTSLWSITNGLMPLGGMIGGVSSGFIADFFGRKNAFFFTNIFVIVTAILNIMSKYISSYETLMVGRFITGLYCGLFTGILPLYISEIAPNNLRGLIGTMNQLTIVFAIFATNVCGLPQIFGNSTLWPLLVGFILVPFTISLGLLFAVESPKYLFINRNDKLSAQRALIKLRGLNNEDLVQKELLELETEKSILSSQEPASWSDLLTRRHLFRPLIVTIGLQMTQQLSGINAVVFYSTNIFINAGLKDPWPVYATILLGVIQLIMTLSCMFLIDILGRRILLLVGSAGMCIFSYVLAATLIFGDPTREWLNYLTILCSIFYVIFFSIGPGPIPWLITSELFNSDARGKATSIAVLANWISNFIVTVSFPFIQQFLGSYSFLIFGTLLVLFTIFIYVLVPETKNKAIEEIVAEFEK